jgi:tetratricopeptide (TPR) repeat protein
VLVADFGLTMSVQAGAPIALAGTPKYMAPELFAGQAADARSDQFSFSVALCEALYGEGLGKAESHAKPLHATGIPKAVRRVLKRGMDRSPEKRYPSMTTLIGELERASRSARRWILAGLAALVVVFLAVVGGARLGRPPPAALAGPAPAPTAITDQPLPEGVDPRAAAIYQAGLHSLRGASNMLAIQSFYRALEIDPSLAAAHVRLIYFGGNDPEIDVGRTHYKAAYDLRFKLGARDRALLDALEPATRDPPEPSENVRRLSSLAESYPLDAEIVWYLGLATQWTGDWERSERAFDRALELDPQFALAPWVKANTQHYHGDNEGALKTLDRCLEISPTAASCLRVRGTLNGLRGSCDRALGDARRVVAVEPGGYMAYHALARALAASDEPTAAVEQALEQKWSLAPASEKSTIELTDRIQLALLRGEFSVAEAHARDLQSRIADVPAERPHGALVARLLDIYEETGNDEMAAAVAEDFLQRQGAWSSGPEDNANDVIANPLARALATVVRAGKLSREGADIVRQAWLARSQATLRPERGLFLWASAYAAPAETAAEARVALEVRSRFGVSEPRFDFPRAATLEAKVHLLAGDAVSALPLLTRSTAACDVLDAPVLKQRGFLLLGETKEQSGDRLGACAAYGQIVRRWANARPTSATAEEARGRALALRCGR